MRHLTSFRFALALGLAGGFLLTGPAATSHAQEKKQEGITPSFLDELSSSQSDQETQDGPPDEGSAEELQPEPDPLSRPPEDGAGDSLQRLREALAKAEETEGPAKQRPAPSRNDEELARLLQAIARQGGGTASGQAADGEQGLRQLLRQALGNREPRRPRRSSLSRADLLRLLLIVVRNTDVRSPRPTEEDALRRLLDAAARECDASNPLCGYRPDDDLRRLLEAAVRDGTDGGTGAGRCGCCCCCRDRRQRARGTAVDRLLEALSRRAPRRPRTGRQSGIDALRRLLDAAARNCDASSPLCD